MADTFYFRMDLALVVCLSMLAFTMGQDLDGFVPGFRIDQLYVPDDCTYRAREGDYMYQEYVGTLEDGTKFDSRYVKLKLDLLKVAKPCKECISIQYKPSLPIINNN